MTTREELSRDLHRVISQHLPRGAVILADEIHESILDVVLPALRDQTSPARGYLFAMMACNPAERERALDAHRDEVARELVKKVCDEGHVWSGVAALAVLRAAGISDSEVAS